MIEVETSGFGLSVGTGLAFEALFIPTLPRVDETLSIKRIELSKDTKIYVSLNTLVRNWFSAIIDRDEKKNFFKTSNLREVIAAITNELNILSGLSADNEIIVYSTVYNKKDVKLTPPLKVNLSVANMVDAIANKIASKLEGVYLKPLMEKFGNAIVLTHSSLDLVNTQKDRGVRLLESHTGKVLKIREFGRKLRKSTLDTGRLPLCRTTLIIFGDSAGLLAIPTPKYKKIAMNALIDENITTLDSDSRIESIIKKTVCAEFL